MTSTLSRPRADPPPRLADPPPRRTWHRVALAVLLAGTAALYLWNLSASGWGNAFYAAASQAGGVSWKAWFFGSSDAANAITVDKAPGALWVSGLSVRIFGLSSWSVLAPQALMGVGSVGLLYACVRRAAGPGAGLLAGAALALTPVAVLMFRYDNPDALLVLLLVGAAYATLRAVERGRARWLVLVGVLVGFGFLAKMLQAFLVVPAFTLVWLAAAPVGWWRRVRGLGLAAVALVVSAGWWVAAVSLWPASDRPFVGGSQTNSVLELVFGYNGFGRITGDEVGSVGGGAGGGWGQTGAFRLFGSEMGAEASWLLPAALLLLAALLWWTRRRPRTDPLRAQALLWGGWLLVTGLTFSFMAGIIHPYYLVAIAPATAALVGLGTETLWRDRSRLPARLLLAAAVAVTAGWSFALLSDASAWLPWLRWVVLGVGLVAAVALTGVHRMPRALAVGVATAALLAGGGGSAAWAVATAATTHSGAIPSSGPAGYGQGPGGRGGPGGAGGGFRGGTPPGGFVGPSGGPQGTTGSTGTGTGSGAGTGAGTGSGSGSGSTGGAGGSPSAAGQGGGTGAAGAGRGPGQQGGRGGGGPGGILSSPTPSAAVTALISADGARYTWAAAAVTSNQAAGYQLATQLPVLAVGGFNGTDPYPTLAQFQQMVAAGRIHWFVGSSGGGGFGGGPGGGGQGDTGGSDAAQQIAAWVAATFPSQTVDGVTLYDLTAG